MRLTRETVDWLFTTNSSDVELENVARLKSAIDFQLIAPLDQGGTVQCFALLSVPVRADRWFELSSLQV